MEVTDQQGLMADLVHKQHFEESFVLDATLRDVIVALGHNLPLMRKVYKGTVNHEHEVAHTPVFGSPMTFSFDYVNEVAEITRGEWHKQFSLTDWLHLLGLIDAVYAPIYPIGTILVLDKILMPPLLAKAVAASGDDLQVVITGRKIPLINEFSSYLADYIVRIWPFGEIPNSGYIVITNMMIQQVVQMGPVNDLDKEFTEQVLRTDQLLDGKISIAYIPGAMNGETINPVAEGGE